MLYDLKDTFAPDYYLDCASARKKGFRRETVGKFRLCYLESMKTSCYTYSALTFFLILSCTVGYSQHTAPCSFDEVNQNWHLQTANQKIQGSIQHKLTSMNTRSGEGEFIRTIPIVVHVIHDGWTENISNAQIESQIQILNEDFGKLEGSNGDGNGVDTKVRFKLAKISPNGDCTSGIVRIRSPLTNHQTHERTLLKELSFWDNERYLNIYIVKYINGTTLGYSSFPGGPPDEDGIVVKHNVFGNTGTALNSLGRTLTHEIGHWFGLYHTFNNGCGDDICADGDYVCDTPPQNAPNFSCTVQNTCSNDIPDENDLRENYMNYTPDVCKNMYTDGQRERIQATLDTIRTLIWSEENLVATGCDSAYSPPFICPVAANFVTLTREICKDNSVRFMDISLNESITRQWTFPGGIPATSTDENPLVYYPDIGSYDVTLVVSDAIQSDSFTIEQYINVVAPGTGDPLNYMEEFNSGVYPPDGISIVNPDEGITWELDSMAYTSPPSSIRINNLINTNYGSIDEIVLPHFDLTSAPFGEDIGMKFNWAYAKSDASFSDELIVLLSTDCGSTWEQIFYRNQDALATGPTQTTPFIPDPTQWKSAVIDLSNYRNEAFVQIKLVNVTDGGNNLYIDDIGVEYTSTTATDDPNFILSGIKAFPNPFADELVIDYLFDMPLNGQLSITDIAGRLIYSQKINNTNHLTTIESTTWPEGLYVVTISTSEKITILKVVKGN